MGENIDRIYYEISIPLSICFQIWYPVLASYSLPILDFGANVDVNASSIDASEFPPWSGERASEPSTADPETTTSDTASGCNIYGNKSERITFKMH